MSHSPRRVRASLGLAMVTALTMAACSSESGSETPAAVETTVAPATTTAAVDTTAAPVETTAAVDTTPAPVETTVPAGPEPDTLASDYAGTEEMPPSEGPAALAGKNVWIVVCANAAEGCVAVANGAVEAGELLGWNVTVADGSFGIGDGYNNAIRQAIAAKADAIGVIGFDCADARASLEDAAAAGIPTFAISDLDCPDAKVFTAEVLMNSQYPNYEDWWVQRGAAQARWVIEKTGGSANVILANAPATSAINLVAEGFKAELATCSGCKIVEEVAFEAIDLVTGVLADKFSASLVAHPDANVAVAPLDTMLLGGNMPGAIAQSGRDILLVGGEGLASAMDLLRDGQSDVEIAFPSEWVGWAAIETINRVLSGGEPVPQGIGWKTIDADNGLADQPSGNYQPAVDFRAAYKALWGK